MTVYIIKFSDCNQVFSQEELEELAIIWNGEIKNGDILTEEYPEDYNSCRKHYPCWASWDEYKGDYSEVEAYLVPVPTKEEYEVAALSGECGEAARKGLLSERATWELLEFIPAHSKYEETWSHSKDSSDGYRSGGRSTVSRGYVDVPDTWVWISSTGMKAELPSSSATPVFKTKYDYAWYCCQVRDKYIREYYSRKEKWEAENIVTIKKPESKKPTAKNKKAAKEAKHPLASKKSGYPELKQYFYSLYPEVQEYEEYIFLCMWPCPHAVFEHRKCGVHNEPSDDGSEKYIYKFDEEKQVDEIVLPVEQLLQRAKAFKTFADQEVAKHLAAKEEAAKLQQQQKLYEAYKKAQEAKKGIVKSFSKWILTIA